VRRPSRRAVLLGGLSLGAACVAGGYELVQDGALPGRYTLARLDGACGSAPPAPSGPRPTLHRATFQSAYRHREVQMATLIPAGLTSARGLGVVIALHGAGGNALVMAGQMAPAMTVARVTRFAVICVDGGNTYWHKHADGDDPIGMILHEVLPRAAAAGMRTGRIGIAGESMGGFGALLLAERLGPAGSPAAAAVAAISPAIFASYADARAANRKAFDSPADFAANDVFTDLDVLRQVPAWIACGQDDPFDPEVVLVRARLGGLTGHAVPGGIMAGCHDDMFFARNRPAALHFVGARLS
jgi:acetyl esterase/lipase